MRNSTNVRREQSKQPPKRLQIDLSDERMAAFDALIDEGGLKTRKDVFDYAMSILHWAVNGAREGMELAMVDQARKDITILRTPMLDHVKLLADSRRIQQPAADDANVFVSSESFDEYRTAVG